VLPTYPFFTSLVFSLCWLINSGLDRCCMRLPTQPPARQLIGAHHSGMRCKNKLLYSAAALTWSSAFTCLCDCSTSSVLCLKLFHRCRPYAMGIISCGGVQDRSQNPSYKTPWPYPRANYTDRATAACRRSDCQLVRIEGATWSA
jgi:hypothetical protein